MSSSEIPAETVHKLILESFRMKSAAYAPYSNFQVGAALLTDNGEIIGGCNVENASYGAGICAERTAMVKAVSQGQKSIIAVAVTSPLPTPTTSPCGICRQFLREFLPLSAPVYIVASTYPVEGEFKAESLGNKEWVEMRTLEELLPLSFGPDHLVQNKAI